MEQSRAEQGSEGERREGKRRIDKIKIEIQATLIVISILFKGGRRKTPTDTQLAPAGTVTATSVYLCPLICLVAGTGIYCLDVFNLVIGNAGTPGQRRGCYN